MNKTYILQAFLVFSIMTGFSASVIQASAAQPSCEAQRIDAFDANFGRYTDLGILNLRITYLPNSKLDRLRVILTKSKTEWGRELYVEQTEPIATSPLKSVTVGQIFNANPYFECQKVTPVAAHWLSVCVENAGFADLDIDEETAKLDPATTLVLLKALIQNQSNLNKAIQSLLSLQMTCEKCSDDVYVDSDTRCTLQ